MPSLDKYTVYKQLGRGSFGVTYLVRSKLDGQFYVLKEMAVPTSRKRDEARNEISILATADHPNIVRYKETIDDTSGSNLCIIMEYADGGDCEQVIKRHRQEGTQVPEAQVGRWIAQILLALKHLHDKKILHRDLKAANVFLSKDGAVKLGDFGLSRTIEKTFDLAQTVCGTPYYFSPEMCNEQPYSTKNDVWALGCVLVEITTLKRAFPAKSMVELRKRILSSEVPVIEGYSDELVKLILWMFTRDVDRRPSVNALICHPYVSRQLKAMSAALNANITRFTSQISDLENRLGRDAGFDPSVPAQFVDPRVQPTKDARKPARVPPLAALGANLLDKKVENDSLNQPEEEYPDDFVSFEELFEPDEDAEIPPQRRMHSEHLLAESRVRRTRVER